MFGLFSQVQGWVKIKGASDGTKIGNSGDSLKALITASALPAGASTEATLEAARVLLSSINGKDFATQTTLASVLAALNTLNSKDFATQTTLAALNSKDFATQTTMAALNSKDFATQTTLEAARVLLASINAKDFSTEATLAAMSAKLNPITSAPEINASGLVVRQVPYELATFSVVAENITVGNNKSMIAIQNTGTSVLKLREVWIINDQTTAVTGVAGEFRLHRITSFSAGTALTPVQFDTTDSLPVGISVATGSTVSGEAGLLRTGKWSTDEWGPGSSDVESMDHGQQQVEPFWKQTPSGKPITLRQNQGAHVRFATNSTAGSFNLRFVFTTE